MLFGTPVGGVVAFRPDPQQSTWIVFKVVDRRTDAPSDPAASAPSARPSWSPSGSGCCSPTAEQVGVRVNPRYGVWDPIQMRVVAADQQVGTILPPAAG